MVIELLAENSSESMFEFLDGSSYHPLKSIRLISDDDGFAAFQASFNDTAFVVRDRKRSPFDSTPNEEAFHRGLMKIIKENTTGSWLIVRALKNKIPIGRYVPDVIVFGLLPSPREIEKYKEQGHSGRFVGTIFEIDGESHSKKSIKDDVSRAILTEMGFHIVSIDNSKVNLGSFANPILVDYQKVVVDMINNSRKGEGVVRTPIRRQKQSRKVIDNLKALAVITHLTKPKKVALSQPPNAKDVMLPRGFLTKNPKVVLRSNLNIVDLTNVSFKRS